MRILNTLAIVSLIIMCSCSHVANENIKEIQGYDDNVFPNGENINIGSFDIVDLEMTDESLIDYILRVECVDSVILVQTSDKLLAFHRKGNFICRYGNLGKGPYEYSRLSSFVMDRNNRIVKIVDGASCRILAFSLDGKPLSDKRYDKRTFSATETCSGIQLSENNILFTNVIYKDKQSLYTIFNDQKGVSDVVFTFPVTTKNTEERTGTSTVSSYNDTIKLLMPFENTIYTLHGSRLCPITKISTAHQMVTRDQIESIDDFSIMTFAEFINDELFTGFTGIYETDQYLFLEISFNLNYFLIDKRSATGKLYEYALSDNQGSLPLINIIGTDSDCLIGLGEPMRLLSMKEQISKNSENKNLSKLREYVNKISLDSNPCLFFYQIL
ncbi:MAG TPA: hypothetical protein DHW31_01835 [Bacteroides graminisolvens]|uniref:6-bladed beta-propeller n=1 Tax=Bacteroides graminisolvens TaxID=477666 RepID=A0A3D2SB78_9BACE|nr:hypothetical protein [Bacteroides graminisolvens]